MALKFRLKGLAETFIDEISCPGCGLAGADDQNFATELTKVTFDGIIVEPLMSHYQQVKLNAEKLNAMRKGDLH